MDAFLDSVGSGLASEGDRLLAAGAAICEEMRKAVLEQTGYKCSAGIAHNKVGDPRGGYMAFLGPVKVCINSKQGPVIVIISPVAVGHHRMLVKPGVLSDVRKRSMNSPIPLS